MNPLVSDLVGEKSDPRVIVALDFDNENNTLAFIRHLDPALCRLKVGKELFTATGRRLVDAIVAQGFDLFLDLKYHDIPNTVAGACRVAADMGVWMVDVHVAGGRRMMEAAANAVSNVARRPILVGVSVLTSLESADLHEVGHTKNVEELVLQGAKLARDSGLDGVVCSAHEAVMLREHLGCEFVLVTPGIRLPSATTCDQKRVMTPEEAFAAGSSYLVMGRPIRQAADPVALLNEINYLARSTCNLQA